MNQTAQAPRPVRREIPFMDMVSLIKDNGETAEAMCSADAGINGKILWVVLYVLGSVSFTSGRE